MQGNGQLAAGEYPSVPEPIRVGFQIQCVTCFGLQVKFDIGGSTAQLVDRLETQPLLAGNQKRIGS